MYSSHPLAIAAAFIASLLVVHHPLAAETKRMGVMASVVCPSLDNSQVLRPLLSKGWDAGRNLVIDCVVAGNQLDKLDALAEQLVARNPDVLVSSSSPMIRALMKATRSIPIVILAGQDPVREGFVRSLNRPEGNVTGFSILGIELFAKRIASLSEIAGRPKKLAILARTGGDTGYREVLAHEADRAGMAIGFEWKFFEAGKAADFEVAFAEISEQKFDAVYIVPSPLARLNSRLVAELALRYRLPAASDYEAFAADGLLMALGADTSRVYDLGAEYIDRILRGAKPSDLPVKQPTEFHWTINLKTARALGLDPPSAVLYRASTVLD